jgi:hypothetical protein
LGLQRRDASRGTFFASGEQRPEEEEEEEEFNQRSLWAWIAAAMTQVQVQQDTIDCLCQAEELHLRRICASFDALPLQPSDEFSVPQASRTTRDDTTGGTEAQLARSRGGKWR